MIKMYEVVRLKNGSNAVIVEILKPDELFVAEVDKADSVDKIEVEIISIEDIAA